MCPEAMVPWRRLAPRGSSQGPRTDQFPGNPGQAEDF